MTSTRVTVRVPATSANLGPGFDALGLALAWYDEVTVEAGDEPGLSVVVEGEGSDLLARDATNLVVRSMHAGFDRFGTAPAGLRVRCRNDVPQGRGLGSSAAAIVAGVVAADALLGGGRDPAQLLALASELEGHPDNVAAALLGGFTVAWTESGAGRAVRLDPAPSVEARVFVPPHALETVAARGLLPATVPHQDAAHAAGRSALVVAAVTRDPTLLLAATEDRLHQPYRAPAMVASAALVRDLRARGVPAVVSGAGPSVLALSDGASHEADDLCPAGWQLRRLPLDRDGARVSTTAARTRPSG